MLAAQKSEIMRFLGGIMRFPQGEEVTDGQLLGRFVEHRDEAAFAGLVRSLGPLVWGVCRRLLSNRQDAEDAFQATFLVLARKASSVTPRDRVANWLHGVARRTTLQARRSARRRREVQVNDMPDRPALESEAEPDLREVLDEELSLLPERDRMVILLCDMAGHSRREAARELGWPEGTVAGRLARARERLRKRLLRRGLALSGAALAAALSQNVASAVMPASVAISTIKAANHFAAGQASISVKVAALAEGVLKTMLLTKLKRVTAVLVVAAMVGLIGYGIARGQPKGDAVAPQKRESEPKAQKDAIVQEKAEKEEATAWGKEVDGLQAGLLAEAATCRPGDKLKFTVKLRNVGKAEVSVTYGMLRECAPQITTDTGGRVSVYMPPPFDGLAVRTKRALKPGETITLYNAEVVVQPEDPKMDGEIGLDIPTICVAPGKYKIAYGGMIQSHPKLTTGTVEFEVKEPVEAVTAWGKEAGGLQAGLGFRPGEKRAYTHGETVTLVVRVRNVGKEEVKIKYHRLFFVDILPTVTDGDGKQIRLSPFPRVYTGIMPQTVDLAPGKEIELAELKLKLRPAKETDEVPGTLYGAGQIQIRHKQLSVASMDPTLSKLATGKLELEVKADPPEKK